MAKHGLRSGASYKAQYKNYANNNTWLKNKIAKLERTVKKQPDNEQAKVALQKALNGNMNYKRRSAGDHICNGMMNKLGYKDNKTTKAIRFSRIWHSARNGASWFGPSAPKSKTSANNAPSIEEQFINLGFTSNARKRKNSSR